MPTLILGTNPVLGSSGDRVDSTWVLGYSELKTGLFTVDPTTTFRRFVTETDLHKLGLGHLLGTALLRAYMHGYFIDSRLYAKAVALAKPFAYEEYRQERIAAKVEEERQSRIAVVRKLPKV